MSPASPDRRARLRVWIDDVLLHRGTAPADEAAWRAQADDYLRRFIKPVAVFMFVAALAWWPFDPLVYPGRPDLVAAFSRWRLSVAAVALVSLVLLSWPPAVRRVWLLMIGAGHLMAISVVVGLAQVPGLDTPWPDALYVLPWSTLPILVRFPARIALTGSIAAVPFAVFAALRPEVLHAPRLASVLGLVLFVMLLSILAGHAGYHTVRTLYFQERILAERTRQLGELAGALESQVAGKTQQLRQLAVHVEEVRESEKAVLSRELHDELGQSHTAMRIELELLQRHLSERPAEVAAHVTRLLAMLDDVQSRTRALVSLLRPRILDDLGLAAAVEWLVDETRRGGLEVSLEIAPDDPVVPAAVATAAFRVLQESLNNVQKHAAAKRVTVRLALGGGRLRLEVTDDGKGLPPPEQWRPGAMGLVGMRERVRALDGDLDIGQGPDGGTRLVVALPAGEREAA